MPPGRDRTQRRRVRPSTASGVLQSTEIRRILEDDRPQTAPGKKLIGLDPTFITSRHHVPGISSRLRGQQVHGGVPEDDFKRDQGRRATVTDLEELLEKGNLLRPTTARASANDIKLEDKITLDHLQKMRYAFQEGDADGSGTLDLEEFKNVFRNFFSQTRTSEDQMTALFMKIDSSSDGEINWDEFCTYMQLEYTEKEESYLRSKEIAFYLPATIHSSSHREQILGICHTADNTFLYVSQDGMVTFWTQSLAFKRTKQIETGSKKNKWITDFVLMPQFNKFIISTGDREIQFFELSTFEPYCQVSGLETTPLRLDYCSTGPDECTIIYGDSLGCVNIFLFSATGETLRTWKKMPKVEGIASVNLDSVINSTSTKYIRWKVHEDWVVQLKYYDSLRSVISCSNHPDTALVIGCTIGSTHVETSLKEANTTSRKAAQSVLTNQVRRRLDMDQTVFRVYKGVKTFDFCKEKNVLVTGGMDRLIRMWNPYVPGKPTGLLRGHSAPIFYLFISQDDDRIFSISTDKTCKVWDLNDQSCLLTVRPKAHKIRGDLTAAHYNPLSRGLAIATSDLIALLPVRSRPGTKDLTTTHKEPIFTVKYNKSFNHVVTTSEGSVVKIWDIETGYAVFEFSGAHEDKAITCMTFDNTERRLITGGRDGRLKIWNYNNGHCLRTLEKVDDYSEISDLTYVIMNKNRYIISVGWDRRINIFSDDNEDFHHVQHPHIYWSDDLSHGHKEDILSVAAFPPHYLATSSYDGEVILWNLVSGHIFCHLRPPKDTDPSAEMDGSQVIPKVLFLTKRSTYKASGSIVAGGPKGIVHIWSVVGGGSLCAAFRPSTYGVSTMTVDDDNTTLYIADTIGFITKWNVEEYCLDGPEQGPPPLIHKWRAHIQSITSIEIVDDFDLLLTSSVDCTVRLWTIEGHFIGTFGQPKLWDIKNMTSYQHPMVPYDVLVDPLSVPLAGQRAETPGSDDSDKQEQEEEEEDAVSPLPTLMSRQSFIIDDKMISEEISRRPSGKFMGKRLRHERLKQKPKDYGGPNAYHSLKCYELDDTPPVPDPPSLSTGNGDPFDLF